MHKLNALVMKDNLLEDEEIKFKRLKKEMHSIYINMAKGSLIWSKAKWLELSERNHYFFALKKQNQKRNYFCTQDQ